MEQNTSNPIGKLPIWQQYILFFILLAASFVLVDKGKQYIALQATPVSAADAQAKMVGIWTFTAPIDFGNDPFPFEWIKWDVRADGTMTTWHASPTSDSWGSGETKPYQIVSDKYATNGERWFGIEDTSGYTVGVYEGGQIVLHMRPAANRKTGAMVRGDKSPFKP